MFDFESLRKDFPFLTKNEPLIYFDNAATSQKPQQVIDAISFYYAHQNAPVHKGIYSRAEEITKLYEDSRKKVSNFLGAYENEIIFTKGTTEGINFIASTWAKDSLVESDEILITELEHHSNMLPWIRIAKEKKIILKYIPITKDGNLNYSEYLKLLNSKTKLVAFTHFSNVLGIEVDADFIIKHAHEIGAKVLLDSAQFIPHKKIDVNQLKPDFLVFSGHKMLGPTGIGILYIARHMHKYVEPYQVGGGMVFNVQCNDASWLKPPHCYEAGTPPIAQAIGLAKAIDYLESINFDELIKYESNLCAQLIEGLNKIKSIKILGPQNELKNNNHIISFVSDKMHPHDIAMYLSNKNIAVRAGNHCAQFLHNKIGVDSSVRISFYLYNTKMEVENLIINLKQIL